MKAVVAPVTASVRLHLHESARGGRPAVTLCYVAYGKLIRAAAVIGLLSGLAGSASANHPAPTGPRVVAEGNLRDGGAWWISAEWPGPDHNGLCWQIETENARPDIPNPIFPTQRLYGSRLCDSRMPPWRLRGGIAHRRCDANTAVLTGYMGAKIKTVVLRYDDGSNQPTTPVRFDGIRGYYALMPSSEPLPRQVVGLDKRGRAHHPSKIRFKEWGCE